ncbi:hypothetical protein NQZ68_035110 [Dissostichus eleginoides]|nr:hypothetical protein NQZ68_035110 [Dissostichus eleginoides]
MGNRCRGTGGHASFTQTNSRPQAFAPRQPVACGPAETCCGSQGIVSCWKHALQWKLWKLNTFNFLSKTSPCTTSLSCSEPVKDDASYSTALEKSCKSPGKVSDNFPVSHSMSVDNEGWLFISMQLPISPPVSLVMNVRRCVKAAVEIFSLELQLDLWLDSSELMM